MITFSIDTDKRSGLGAFQIIENSFTQANPDGNPSLAWHNLNRTYAARNVPSYFNYLQMYRSMRLQGNNMPPKELITRLEYLRGETNMNRPPNVAELSEQDTIMQVLNFLPALYDSERFLDAQAGPRRRHARGPAYETNNKIRSYSSTNAPWQLSLIRSQR